MEKTFEYPIEIIKKDGRLVAFAESPSKDECVYLELSSDLNVNEGDKFSIFNNEGESYKDWSDFTYDGIIIDYCEIPSMPSII